MYFKNKSNTNIDTEFNNDNILSHTLKILNKYKLIFIIIFIIILMLLMILLFTNRKITNYLILNGEENIIIYQGSDYVELGYKSYNSKNIDLTDKVEINSTLNTDKIGEYEIVYTVKDVSKVRKITVIEKPTEYTYIYLNTVDNDVNVYLKLGESYEEPGYQVFSSSGSNINSKVKIEGTVDTSKKGSYKLVYSIVDSNGVTVSATRTVVVMDPEINLTLSTKEYTNKDITINISIVDNYFDYIVLPDGSKKTEKTYQYKVNTNGKYTFTMYNKKGISKESTIEVTNIDKESPTGSCSGSYANGKSTITVSAKDNIEISKYVINNKEYKSNKITINSELTTVNITIYDKANNQKNINCNLVDKNEILTSDKSITFSYQYVKEDNIMPYALYIPSTAKNSTKNIPLIIWLHGSGEVSSSENKFINEGMPNALNNWKLYGFNAYVLCPHLTGKYANTWHNETTREYLNNLIDKIIKEKNIDTNKIIITGHSMGGQGALYMAAKDDRYSALVVYSGYYQQTPITNITIPTIGYIGNSGEDDTSIAYMKKYFVEQFGEESLHTVNTSHGNVPLVALNLDENNDNKSDLIEWMLSQ